MDYLAYVLAVGFALISWLLANKDSKQQAEITKLFAIHDADVKDLAELKITIAGKHYERAELDVRFKELDATIKDGFKELGADIKDMTKALNENLKEHLREYHPKE